MYGGGCNDFNNNNGSWLWIVLIVFIILFLFRDNRSGGCSGCGR